MENSIEKKEIFNFKQTLKMVFLALGVVLALLGIFYLGRLSASENKFARKGPGNLAFNEFRPNQPNKGLERRSMGGRDFVRDMIEGEIEKIDSDILTIKDSDNTEYSIKILDETSISEDQKIAKKSDLKVGDKIAVRGSANSSGQIQARIIEIN